jgi:phage tail-like protein
MANNLDNQLLRYLPELFREDPATRDFLLAFEKLLLGRTDAVKEAQVNNPQGLEQTIEDLARYFTPGENPDDGTPEDFLPWLSQWVALSLRTDIDNTTRRAFVANMAKLYRDRGTKKGMQLLLEVLTKKGVTINDQIDGEPHYFIVMLDLEAVKASDSIAAFERAKEIAHAVIGMEKPAHTRYLLIPAITTMRIGQREQPSPGPTKYFIRVGKNTRLGAARWKKNL